VLGFVITWRLATSPTKRSPSLANATTDGVVRLPSAFGITTASPASNTATHEFVVPKSIPITFPIYSLPPKIVFIKVMKHKYVRRLKPQRRYHPQK